jgi:hypothetical protein
MWLWPSGVKHGVRMKIQEFLGITTAQRRLVCQDGAPDRDVGWENRGRSEGKERREGENGLKGSKVPSG